MRQREIVVRSEFDENIAMRDAAIEPQGASPYTRVFRQAVVPNVHALEATAGDYESVEYGLARGPVDNSGVSPETLAAISNYLRFRDSSGGRKQQLQDTKKSSDSNKENWDPEETPAEPRNTHVGASQSPIDRNSYPDPPDFEMSRSVSEILFDERPSCRVLLNTSTVRNDWYRSNRNTDQNDDRKSDHSATQRSESRNRSLRQTVVSGKLDAFLAAEYAKRPTLKTRRLSLTLNVVDNGYLGGSLLRGEVCLKVKRLREGAFVHASKVEIALVCVEEIGSNKRVIDSRKLFMREDLDFANGGLNVLQFEVALPELFGPGYFRSPRAKIRYMLFVCMSASLNDQHYMLRSARDIKFFNIAHTGETLPLESIRAVCARGTIFFAGSGPIFLNVMAAQDYFEAGKSCYLRTTIGNCSSRVVTKLKMSVVRRVEYLRPSRRSGVDEHVIAKSVVKAGRDGWPRVESGENATYTSCVGLPEFSISIINSGFRVAYYVDVAVGGFLKYAICDALLTNNLSQFVKARFPITILCKSDGFGTQVSCPKSMRGPLPEVFSTLRSGDTDRYIAGHLEPIEYLHASKTEQTNLVQPKNGLDRRLNFSASGPEAEWPPRAIVLKRDVHHTNGVDGFITMQSMVAREDREGVDGSRLRELLVDIAEDAGHNDVSALQRTSEVEPAVRDLQCQQKFDGLVLFSNAEQHEGGPEKCFI